MKYRKLASGFVAAAMAVGVFATPFGEALPVIRESVAVNAGAEVYGDFEYSVSGDTAEITKYKGSASALVIPSEIDGKKVTGIGRMAFASCTTLTDVTIPDSVTSIGDWAFSDCDAIVNVKIPDTVTYLGEYAFRSCSSLKSVHIPKGIKTIEMRAFLSCSSLESLTIPENITSIGLGAFSLCKKLTDVTIPGNVKTVGEGAFSNCTGLLNVTISDGVTSIGKSAFASCYLLKSITIADSVTSIGDDAFYWCSNLTSVKLPKNLGKINSYAFRFCKGLTDISIPDGITSIDRCAFMGCEALTKVIIPKSVTVIDESAFYGCKVLADVTIPEGVTTIGEEAFCGCTALLSVKIPKSVTAIGDHAFGYNESYTKTAGFKVYCYKNSAGEKYANDNSFICETVSVTTIDAVTGFDADKVTSGSATLKWDKVSDADGYAVELYTGGKWNEVFRTSDSSVTSCTVGSLKGNSTYSLRIRAFAGTAYSDYTRLAVKTKLANVAGLKAQGVTATAVKLDWARNTGATGYIIEQYKGGKWTQLVVTKNNMTLTFTVKGLAECTPYSFRVKAYKNDGGKTNYSDYVTVKASTLLGAVKNAKVTSVTGSWITLEWAKNDKATGYSIEQYKGGKWTVIATTKNNATLKFTVKGLKNDTTYSFRIRAYKTVGGVTAYSDYVRIAGKTRIPNVAKFTGSAVSASAVKLDWSKNDKATAYVIEQYKGGKWTAIATTKNNTTLTFTVKGLAKGTAYSFRIKSFRKTGSTTEFSEYASVKVKTVE